MPMPQWPIRTKLYVGLSVVLLMMLTLMGGSFFGLHSFHLSNITLTDQLRELGASTRLLRTVVQIDALREDTAEERAELKRRVVEARSALGKYCEELRGNTSRGHRQDFRDELGLAFQIDHELSAILAELAPAEAVEPILPGTQRYMSEHPELRQDAGDARPERLEARIDRLNRRVMALPDVLYRDFFAVLTESKGQYESSRVIVWVSAFAVLGMLLGLSMLFHRWVLDPVRLLHRGVRRVARGAFDYKIKLQSGDEMQALAEAFNDMTAQLSTTYADLERQVNDRSRQLVRSERLAGVGFLAAGVAHEINNPLASIAFCSEALESRLRPMLEAPADGEPERPRGGRPQPPIDPKVVGNYLRMIQDEAFRCKRITEKLLDFSRCGEIQRTRTDLGELVRSVAEMVQHMGKYRQKHVVVHQREAVFAHVDPQEIKQVVLNLVVNALDSMEAGGTLRIELRPAGRMAELAFLDDGCGMAPDVLENIFEPFFTRRKVGKGTGLGLSITHRIVCQHSGEIHATSPGEGLGSTFLVRLPVRPPEAVAAPVSPSPSPSSTTIPALAAAEPGPAPALVGDPPSETRPAIAGSTVDAPAAVGPVEAPAARSA